MTFKERRVPQDEFCGAYFSASMPGQVVKEAMQNPVMMVCVCVCMRACVRACVHIFCLFCMYAVHSGAQDNKLAPF